VKKRINDIRIKALHKEEETDGSCSVLCKADREDSFISLDSKVNLRELMNSNRRNLLKMILASGGVLLTGTFLSKINKFNHLPLISRSMKTNGPMSLPAGSEFINADDLNGDYDSFFKNFSIVKNQKEYILYNKEGDSILTIDRDE
jgi:hypothetical protein